MSRKVSSPWIDLPSWINVICPIQKSKSQKLENQNQNDSSDTFNAFQNFSLLLFKKINKSLSLLKVLQRKNERKPNVFVCLALLFSNSLLINQSSGETGGWWKVKIWTEWRDQNHKLNLCAWGYLLYNSGPGLGYGQMAKQLLSCFDMEERERK